VAATASLPALDALKEVPANEIAGFIIGVSDFSGL
jgi:hypothetical protein